MEIKNEIDCPDYFLKRIVIWCCNQLDFKHKYIERAEFKYNRKSEVRAAGYPSYSGTAYCRENRIVVRISPNSDSFPCETRIHRNNEHIVETINDRLEAIIMVTAHEVAHLYQWHKNEGKDVPKRGGLEVVTDRYAYNTLRIYRVNKERLHKEWYRK